MRARAYRHAAERRAYVAARAPLSKRRVLDLVPVCTRE
jgi:hypothetical protein